MTRAVGDPPRRPTPSPCFLFSAVVAHYSLVRKFHCLVVPSDRLIPSTTGLPGPTPVIEMEMERGTLRWRWWESRVAIRGAATALKRSGIFSGRAPTPPRVFHQTGEREKTMRRAGLILEHVGCICYVRVCLCRCCWFCMLGGLYLTWLWCMNSEDLYPLDLTKWIQLEHSLGEM